MKKRILASLASILLLAGLPVFSSAQEAASEPELTAEQKEALIDETIRLARKFLGGEEKLNAIRSVHMKGVMIFSNGDSGTVELKMKKPAAHLFQHTINGVESTQAIFDTEAWQRQVRLDRPNAPVVDLLSVQEIIRMKANVADAFGFYARPATKKGKVTYEGTKTIDGREARALAYLYGDGVWFLRYFDAETGQLLRTLTDYGSIKTVSGEIMVDGVRFPAKQITHVKTEGGFSSIELSFSAIEINKEFDDKLFKFPAVQ